MFVDGGGQSGRKSMRLKQSCTLPPSSDQHENRLGRRIAPVLPINQEIKTALQKDRIYPCTGMNLPHSLALNPALVPNHFIYKTRQLAPGPQFADLI